MTDLIEREPGQAGTPDHPDPAAESEAKHSPRDDRWPDYFALGMLAFALFVFVVALVPPWHRYFAQPNDAVSVLTIPIVPSLVYAALLAVMGVALRRRLRAAWWILVVWWLVLPRARQDRRCWSTAEPVSRSSAS